jgi:NitT/TauT family transport system substrate-binding protein
LRTRALLSIAVAAIAGLSLTAVPATSAAKAPKAGGACTSKQVGQSSGGLVCSKNGKKYTWAAASTTTAAPVASPTPVATTAAPTTAPKAIRNVNVNFTAVYTGLPMMVAMAKGIDKKHGLKIVPINSASGAEIARQTIAGELQIAQNSPPNIAALIDQGNDMVVFGQMLNNAQFDIIIRSDVPTPNASAGWQGAMKDLAGKNIGVIARGVAAEDVIRSLFKLAGVNPDGQTYVATGLAATTIASLSNKQIDAAINVEPTISLAIQQGLGKSAFALRRGEGPALLQWPGLYMSAKRDYAKANPEVLKDFVATIEEATDFVENPANKDEIYKLMKDQMGLDTAIADVLTKENKGIFPKDAKVDIAKLQNFLNWANAVGTSLNRRKPSDILFTP